MKKHHFLVFITLLRAITVFSQETIYDYVELGKYQVGFHDTLVFDSEFNYEAYDYNGSKPYFVQIWHPTNKSRNSNNFLCVQDWFEFEPDTSLKQIQNQLKKSITEIFIQDFIATDLVTNEENQFGAFSHKEIFGLVEAIETKSIRSPIRKSVEFPVIVYHHGSQSSSFENYVMAEYFASRGFIFVASNFHLPYENTTFGLTPLNKLVQNQNKTSIKFILDFARSLTSSKDVFYIGHSWGAQMGLKTFKNNNAIRGMVSLETTLEFKKDERIIEDMWPELYEMIFKEKATYPFPILFCAATGEEKPFSVFDNLSFEHKTFASTRPEFQHNAYLSAFYLRNFIDVKIIQEDKKVFEENIIIYTRYLEEIERFINIILKKETKNQTETVFVE